MEIDLEHAGGGSPGRKGELQAEVCVVGGGIAGLLLADRLAGHGIDVLLIEAGGLEASGTELAAGGAVSALGGTSLVWGGQLLPLQDTAGWPLDAAALAPYYPNIEALFGVDALPYEAVPFFREMGVPAGWDEAKLPLLVPRVSKFAPFAKRNLGTRLGRELLRHRSVRVALGSRAVGVILSADGSRVHGVRVRGRSGRMVEVKAREVVLAAGTVETCRLLLASRSVMPDGVGNGYGQVGANFHDHLTVTAARFQGRAREQVLRCFRPWVVGGLGGTVHSIKLEPSEQLRRECSAQFGMAHFTFEEPEGTGLAAIRGLLRARQGGQWRLERGELSRLPQAVREGWALQSWAEERQQRYLSPRAEVALRVNCAQRTPSASRISLAAALDAGGEPEVAIERKITSGDVEDLRLFSRTVYAQMASLRLAEADGALWNPELLSGDGAITDVDDARHAMGGACMGTDPQTSVVDGDLRVHGIGNLHIASAAVFPDGRAQLPTLTLMALSLRLADRLRARLA